MAARILSGETPAAIPMINVAQDEVWINEDAAKSFGVVFPPGVVPRTKQEPGH
jgi:ABC-type uncharacterized transport system substrate-binding protein